MELKQRRLVSERDYNGQDQKIHRRNMEQALADFNSRSGFFERRKRARDFFKGDQWKDIIYDNKFDDNVAEEEYLQRRGRLTTKNNQIDPIIRNLVGQFRESYPSSVVFGRNRDDAQVADMMTESLRYVEDLNQVTEIDVHQFREALISGAFGNRVEYEWWDKLNRSEVTVDPINQSRFAYNADLQDIRLKDLKRWVYLHDLEIDEIASIYATSPKEVDKILEWYGRSKDDLHVHWDQLTGTGLNDSINFYVSSEYGKNRVVEVWRKEYRWEAYIHDHETGENSRTEMSEDEVRAINDERIQRLLDIKIAMYEAQGHEPTRSEVNKMRQAIIDSQSVPLIDYEERYAGVWYTYHYTPYGDLLFESETPYTHEESPIELQLHPMVDGEVYGLVHSIIDQQKYFNRMISMLDFLITSSAKGVLMIDKNMVPKEFISKNVDGTDNLDAFLDRWVEFDGVIYYESDPNNPTNMPQHIVNNSMPAGMNDMIRLQHDLLEKISGVVGPVAGHNPSAGTPASLYMQQTVNASMTNRDIFETFFTWMKRRNKKVLQLIQQYWDEVRFIRTGGQRSSRAASIEFDPAKIIGIDFDLVVSEGQQSAVFRQMIDQQLKEYMLNQLITFEEYLEESTMPYADTLLEKIRDRKAAQQAADAEEANIQMQHGASPQQVEQAQQQSVAKGSMQLQR